MKISMGVRWVVMISLLARQAAGFDETPLRKRERVPKGVAPATVSIDPGTILLDPVTAGSFAVRIDSGATPVGAYDFILSWAPEVFSVEAVEPGSSTEFGAPISNIDNEAGQLAIADFQFSSLTKPTGSFTVAIIEFTAGVGGSTPIDITVEELVDTNAVMLAPTINDGVFSIIGGATPTPTPSGTSTPTPTTQITPTHTPQPIPTAKNPGLDVDGDGRVGPGDLLLLLGDWGRPIGGN